MKISKKNIKDYFSNYEKGSNSHSFDNLTEMIHKDAIYRFSDGDFIGIESIKKAFINTWKKLNNDTYKIKDLKVIYNSNDSVGVYYNFKWTTEIDGIKKSGGGRGTSIVIYENGRLQCVYEHLSS